MRDWCLKINDFIRGAWHELPLETLSTAVAAVSLIVLVQSEPAVDLAEIWLLRLFFTAVAVTPLFFTLTLLRWRGVVGRRAQYAIGAPLAMAIAVLIALGTPDSDAFELASFVWPYGLSVMAAVLVPFVTIAVTAPRGHRLGDFTLFVRRFFEQTTTWGLLLGAGMVALIVIFVSLDELFDLDVEKLAAQTAIFATGVWVLMYLFRLLPGSAAGQDDARLPEFWRRLVTTVGAPFVSTMLAILVTYEIYVFVQGEMPRNLLSPLIIAAGFVGFVCTLIIVSILRQDVGSAALAPADPHRWAKRGSIRLVRAFPVVLLALLPMAGWALNVRIEQYGFTPFRVARMMALLCLAVLGVIGTARWLRGRMALTWEVPACVIAFAAATAFGPVSAVELSVNSQTKRLDELLSRAAIGAATSDRIVHFKEPEPSRLLDSETYWALEQQIEDVAELGGEDALRRVLSGNVEQCADRWSGRHCLRLMGIDVDSGQPATAAPVKYLRPTVTEAVSSEVGDLEFIELNWYDDHVSSGYRLALGQNSIHLDCGGSKVAEVSLAEYIQNWQEAGALPARAIDMRDEVGNSYGQLAIRTFEYQRTSSSGPETTRVRTLSGVWLQPAGLSACGGAKGPGPKAAGPRH